MSHKGGPLLFKKGMRVKLQNIVMAPKYNGEIGVVVEDNNKDGRIGVRISAEMSGARSRGGGAQWVYRVLPDKLQIVKEDKVASPERSAVSSGVDSTPNTLGPSRAASAKQEAEDLESFFDSQAEARLRGYNPSVDCILATVSGIPPPCIHPPWPSV